MATSSVSLKLFIDPESNKVLFAEAGKEFVDFLFNLMTLPVGTVTRLLTKDLMVGSLGNLYDSIESISESYLIGIDQPKEALLKPKLVSSSISQVPLLPEYPSVSRKVYICNCASSYHLTYYSDDPNTACPYSSSKLKMSRELVLLGSSAQLTVRGNNDVKMGFVNAIVTYMVTDDLVVKPISSFTMLKSFNIKDIGTLQEKVIHLDVVQGVKLLKASMQTKEVLTSVFLDDSHAPSNVASEKSSP